MSRRIRTVLLAVTALALVAAGTAYATVAIVASAGDPVRTTLAAADNPVGAKGRTLAVSHVTIPTGAKLALHRHLGTQISHIDRGVLTYTVVRGTGVTVMSGSPDTGKAKVVRRINPGQTGQIRAGQWIVEQPTTIHRAANLGKQGIAITLATLLERGAPAATPVKE